MAAHGLLEYFDLLLLYPQASDPKPAQHFTLLDHHPGPVPARKQKY